MACSSCQQNSVPTSTLDGSTSSSTLGGPGCTTCFEIEIVVMIALVVVALFVLWIFSK
jgi:hypothetical protein